MKHLWKALALTLALAALPMLGLAQETMEPAQEAIGAAAMEVDAAYTLEETLNFALQDEYLAKATYEVIQEVFGVNNPFANIMKAEITHQELLLGLFDAYGFTVPQDTAMDYVVIPATLQETYETGIAVEIANIAMYEAFLSRNDLPQDVRDVLTELRDASINHLDAFTRNAEKLGAGLGNGQELGRNRKPDSEIEAPDNASTFQSAAADAYVTADQQVRGGRFGRN